MAKAVFFLEDNLDVSKSLLLFFTSICDVELQTDCFIGRKGSLKLCMGIHFTLTGFLAKQELISNADLQGRFCFSAIHTLLNILQTGANIMQTFTVFIFPVYSQWVKFCPEIWNKAFAIGRNTHFPITVQNLTHFTRTILLSYFFTTVYVFPSF